MSPSSTKPYLIRALYEWCVDQGFTPYLTVHVNTHTRVPSGYVRDGQIVLNIGPHATDQLKIDNEQISFHARFGGVAHFIVSPIDNVLAIFARENGQGMAFDLPDNLDEQAPADPEPPTDPAPPTPRGSHLKVIK